MAASASRRPALASTAETNPRRRKKRRKNPRKKNMSTGAKVAIGAAIVLVGLPLALFTIGAIGVAKIATKGTRDIGNNVGPGPAIDTRPMFGTDPSGVTWSIYQSGGNPPLSWSVYVSSNFPVDSGSATTYEDARAQIAQAIASRS